MKKTIKYTMLTFLFLIIIVSLFYIFISRYENKKVEKDNSIISVSTSTAETYNFSTMTLRDKAMLGLSTTLNYQVIRRSATGTPTDYRIIK